MYTSLSYPALLFDKLITLTLTNCDNIIQEQSAGSESEVYVDFYHHLTLCVGLIQVRRHKAELR